MNIKKIACIGAGLAIKKDTNETHGSAAIDVANAMATLTESDEFGDYDWSKIKLDMKRLSFVFDGRKILKRGVLEELGFKYYAIGE